MMHIDVVSINTLYTPR